MAVHRHPARPPWKPWLLALDFTVFVSVVVAMPFLAIARRLSRSRR